MSRKGCPNKIHSGIYYPRRCDQCGYEANNPAMYFYHKKTHLPIPEGTLCDHGCGQNATVRGTGGVYSCSPNSHRCPEYLRKHSEQVSHQWLGDETRKEVTKESLIRRLHNRETVEKMQRTLQLKYDSLRPSEMTNYKRYARRLRGRAQQWAKEQGYILGRTTWHVDHKFSIKDAWRSNLPIGIVGHSANLCVISSTENIAKGRKSSITLEELIQNIMNMNLLNDNTIS